MKIGVLEGYRVPRSKSHRRRSAAQRARDAKMKTCARSHKVTSRGFWACVRRKPAGHRHHGRG